MPNADSKRGMPLLMTKPIDHRDQLAVAIGKEACFLDEDVTGSEGRDEVIIVNR
jgi:hypothetical protein